MYNGHRSFTFIATEYMSYEDLVEFHIQPERIFKPFVADIYESGNLEPQSVFCYPLCLENGVVDVEIKMLIMLKPSAIRDDVEGALYSEYGLTLGNLKFSLAPQDKYIAI